MRKYPTNTDIRDAADKILETKKEVSTLEIKKALRDLGFYIIQSDVSDAMRESANEGTYQFSFNGTFRLYSKVPSDNVVLPACSLSNNTTYYSCSIDDQNELIIEGIDRSKCKYQYVKTKFPSASRDEKRELYGRVKATKLVSFT